MIPLLFNTPSSSIITFLPRSRCVFISWLQSPLAVITVLNCSLLPPGQDAPPCPAAPRGSASPFKGPMLVRLLPTTNPLTARTRLHAGSYLSAHARNVTHAEAESCEWRSQRSVSFCLWSQTCLSRSPFLCTPGLRVTTDSKSPLPPHHSQQIQTSP